VASIGHSHPRVVEALTRQAAQLNTHTRYLHEGVLDYAEKLLATMPPELGNVMFTCTGSEANDLALRIARDYSGGTGVIVTRYAYHGMTASIAELSPSVGDYVPLGRDIRVVDAPLHDPADPAGRSAVRRAGACGAGRHAAPWHQAGGPAGGHLVHQRWRVRRPAGVPP
jgi:4-aminobutyrate aminotransferase-like enzyme